MIQRQVRLAKRWADIATPEQTREMLKIGVTYKTTDETLANLGLPPNVRRATKVFWCTRPTAAKSENPFWLVPTGTLWHKAARGGTGSNSSPWGLW